MFTRLFNFLASLKLAVATILAVAIACAVGTMYESDFSAEVARRKVYATWWFTGILLLLSVNVTCAAFRRYPWKMHQAGFVITHAGIVILLAGSIIDQHWGEEGELWLLEGAAARDMYQRDEDAIYLSTEEMEKPLQFLVGEMPAEGHLAIEAATSPPSEIVLHKYLAHAERHEHLENDAPSENPAVTFLLKSESRGMKQDGSLFLLDPNQNRLALGLMEAEFIRIESEAKLKEFLASKPRAADPKAKMGTLTLTRAGRRLSVSVEEALNGGVEWKGTGLRIEILDYFPDFAMAPDGRPTSRSQNPVNPAVLFKILGDEIEEHVFVFAKHPEFGTSHPTDGKKSSGVKAVLAGPEAGPSNLLTFILGPQNALHYRVITRAGETRSGRLEPDTAYALPWMDMTFTLRKFLPRARTATDVLPLTPPEKKEARTPAYQVSIREGGKESKAQWLFREEPAEFVVGERRYGAAYARAQAPLGFKMMLKEFTAERYEGSNRPADFRSKVTLKDPEKGVTLDKEIFMNNPLQYSGYTIYQSSYIEGEKDITILGVARDPGLYGKYVGCLLIVGGIVFMFYVRPRLLRRRAGAAA